MGQEGKKHRLSRAAGSADAIKERRERNRKRRNDVIFIAALVAVIAIAGACLYLFRGEGNTVIVSVDGKVISTYALNENRTEDIRTGKDGLNRLVIKDGKAWVETASCPDGICAAHKPIHRDGESIVCLPNKVVVTIEATDSNHAEQPDIDVVV